MEKKCLVCASGNIVFFSKKETYDFFICRNCQLIFMYPQPGEAVLIEDFYSEKSGYHAKLHSHLPPIENKKFAGILDKLGALNMEGNILDVGCANGEFLMLAKKRGFNTFGVEVNKHTADIAKNNGVDVFNGTLEGRKFPDNFFSVIHLGDVIEHVTRPDELLKECRRILKKGGVMVIATPNADCSWVSLQKIACRWFGLPWSVLIPPYHLYLFSGANLEQFLDAMGFLTLEINYRHCSLRHELGATNLWQQYRNNRSAVALVRAIIVFSIYAVLYGISLLSMPFSKKNFEMQLMAKKQ